MYNNMQNIEIQLNHFLDLEFYTRLAVPLMKQWITLTLTHHFDIKNGINISTSLERFHTYDCFK